MKYSFEIPGRLPGLNEIIAACRAHPMAGANQKKKAGKLCAEWIMVGRVPVFTEPVRVHFDWFLEDRRRDPDNVRAGVKFILDSLVEMGKLPNDNQKNILGLSDTFSICKENPRVVVTIEKAA